jgi:ElaB/YqjD/DUF883 family membrane-anchored ribosome-binding protein
MDDRTELEARIERTRDALTDKAHQLEERVAAVRERVAHAVDVPGLYREKPWRFVGAALVAGLLTGWWSAPA